MKALCALETNVQSRWFLMYYLSTLRSCVVFFFVCFVFFVCVCFVVCLLLVLISVGYSLCSSYVVYCMIAFVTDERKRFFLNKTEFLHSNK